MMATEVWQTPNVSDSPPPRDQYLAKIEVSMLSVMFSVMVVGNMLALTALCARRRRQLSRMHYFILHLCISDLTVAFFHLLPQLIMDITGSFVGGYPGDNLLCKFVKFMQLLGPYLSSYVLVVTAVDRYQAICFPLRNCSWTPRRSKIMIGCAWLISVLGSLPQLLIFSYTQAVPFSHYDCWATFVQPWGEATYVMWNMVTIFLIPLLILFFTYTGICRAIWVNFRQKNDDSQPLKNSTLGCSSSCSDMAMGTATADKTVVHPIRSHNSVTRISRAKMKTVKLTVAVILCYMLCSLPYFGAMIYVKWISGSNTQQPNNMHEDSFLNSYAFAILALLVSLNSCVNPWLYLLFNENLWLTLRRLLRCGWPEEEKPVPFSHSSLSDSRLATILTLSRHQLDMKQLDNNHLLLSKSKRSSMANKITCPGHQCGQNLTTTCQQV